jgi:2-aminoethylphosphonate-pyruvate transaminase
LIAIVHCETSSGVVNLVPEVAALARKLQPEAAVFVDGMSSFGAIPLDLQHVDYLVSSANKCLQGVPGFSYAICRKSKLFQCKGNCKSLCLDLVDQVEVLDKTSQFRFTPPTHTLLAFRQALAEFWKEGGTEGRAKRYFEKKLYPFFLSNKMVRYVLLRPLRPELAGRPSSANYSDSSTTL